MERQAKLGEIVHYYPAQKAQDGADSDQDVRSANDKPLASIVTSTFEPESADKIEKVHLIILPDLGTPQPKGPVFHNSVKTEGSAYWQYADE